MSADATRFIGREGELESLTNAWRQVAGGQPRVCILRGESGFGKTRIVQAFYSWLSKHPEYNPHGYWPNALLADGGSLQINPLPSGFGAAKDIPWLWWGVRWSDPGARNRSELSNCAFVDGRHPLEPHLEALAAGRERLKRAGKAIAEVGAAWGELLSFGVVGATKSLYEVAELWKEERRAQAQEQLSVQERQEQALRAQIDRLLDYLTLVLDAELPVILVLDDAQWIDSRSVDLIRQLLVHKRCRGWRLMVLVTHWERDWNLQAQDFDTPSFPALYAQLKIGEAGGLAADLVDVGRLKGLENVLRHELPGLTREQVEFLSSRADGNPRLLTEMILELQEEESYFEDEDLTRPLSPAALEGLWEKSFALEDVQLRRFRKLDKGLRRLLGYGSWQGITFVEDFTLDLAEQIDPESKREANAELLARAVQPYAILVKNAANYEFRQSSFWKLALETVEQSTSLVASLKAALLTIASKWLEPAKFGGLSFWDQGVVLHALGSLDTVDGIPSDLRLRIRARRLTFYLASGFFDRARELSDLLEAELPKDGRIATDVLSNDDQQSVISVWLALGRDDACEAMARGLVEVCREAPVTAEGSNLRELAVAQAVLGDVLRGAGKKQEEALELYRQSIATFEALLEKHGRTPERLRDVAALQSRLGDVLLGEGNAEARAFYSASLAIAEQILREVGSTRTTLQNLAVSQKRMADVAENVDEAVKLCEQSLANQVRIMKEFGSSFQRRRDVAFAESVLGNALVKAGEFESAGDHCSQALRERELLVEHFGETPSLLRDLARSQYQFADLCLKVDMPTEAVNLFRQLLVTCEQLLGNGDSADHLEMLAAALDRLGHGLALSDDISSARTVYERCLSVGDRLIREFGNTAHRREALANVRLDLARILPSEEGEAAVALYELGLAQLDEIAREEGDTDARLRENWEHRVALADLLRERQAPVKAIVHYDRALADLFKIESDSDVDDWIAEMVRLQCKLGGTLLEAKQQMRAVAVYEEALAKQEACVRDLGRTPERLDNLAFVESTIGDALLLTSDLAGARRFYDRAMTRLLGIVSEYGATAERLTAVATGYRQLSRLAMKAGLVSEARHNATQGILTLESALLIEVSAEAQEQLHELRTWAAELPLTRKDTLGADD